MNSEEQLLRSSLYWSRAEETANAIRKTRAAILAAPSNETAQIKPALASGKVCFGSIGAVCDGRCLVELAEQQSFAGTSDSSNGERQVVTHRFGVEGARRRLGYDASDGV